MGTACDRQRLSNQVSVPHVTGDHGIRPAIIAYGT
jgi:hypothetical protein